MASCYRFNTTNKKTDFSSNNLATKLYIVSPLCNSDSIKDCAPVQYPAWACIRTCKSVPKLAQSETLLFQAHWEKRFRNLDTPFTRTIVWLFLCGEVGVSPMSLPCLKARLLDLGRSCCVEGTLLGVAQKKRDQQKKKSISSSPLKSKLKVHLEPRLSAPGLSRAFIFRCPVFFRVTSKTPKS